MDRHINYRLMGLAGFFSLMASLTSLHAFAQNSSADSGGVSAMEQAAFPISRVVLVAESGRYSFDVEVATTDDQRRLGLMNRPQLGKNSGMLFDYGSSREVAMWMKNTIIPLDMIFVAADGRIIRIAENTEPFSLSVVRSGGEARAVLEVNAGTAARLGLKPGDRIEHDIFRNSGG